MGDPHAEIPPRPKSSRATYKIMQSFLIKDVWIDVKVGAIAGHLLYGLVGDRLDEVYKRKYDICQYGSRRRNIFLEKPNLTKPCTNRGRRQKNVL